MLGKLLKYDLKWVYKPLIVFYLLALIFSIIGRGLTEIENSFIFNIVGKICIGAAIAMIVNVLINNLMRVWVRFIRNMYKDEAYLTHTLPVRKSTIYLSKILSAIITMITSSLVILLCIAICYYSKENLEWLKQAVEFMANAYDSTVISFVMTILIVLFLELLFALFAGYIGIILGHKSNNMKMVKSVIFGFISYMIPSIVTLIGLYILGFFNVEVMNLFNTVTETLSIDAMKSVLYAGMVMYVFYIVIYYFIGKKQIEKGINVD